MFRVPFSIRDCPEHAHYVQMAEGAGRAGDVGGLTGRLTVGSGESVSMPPSARMRAQACIRKGVNSRDSAVMPAHAHTVATSFQSQAQ